MIQNKFEINEFHKGFFFFILCAHCCVLVIGRFRQSGEKERVENAKVQVKLSYY